MKPEKLNINLSFFLSLFFFSCCSLTSQLHMAEPLETTVSGGAPAPLVRH